MSSVTFTLSAALNDSVLVSVTNPGCLFVCLFSRKHLGNKIVNILEFIQSFIPFIHSLWVLAACQGLSQLPEIAM